MPLSAVNETRGAVLATRVRRATTFFARLRGLMLAPPLDPGSALLIAPCSGVHTMFMRYPIDVLHLDGHGRVLVALAAMRPWRLGPVVPRTRAVLELPAGVLAKTGSRDGDRVTFGPAAAQSPH